MQRTLSATNVTQLQKRGGGRDWKMTKVDEHVLWDLHWNKKQNVFFCVCLQPPKESSQRLTISSAGMMYIFYSKEINKGKSDLQQSGVLYQGHQITVQGPGWFYGFLIILNIAYMRNPSTMPYFHTASCCHVTQWHWNSTNLMSKLRWWWMAMALHCITRHCMNSYMYHMSLYEQLCVLHLTVSISPPFLYFMFYSLPDAKTA